MIQKPWRSKAGLICMYIYIIYLCMIKDGWSHIFVRQTWLNTPFPFDGQPLSSHSTRLIQLTGANEFLARSRNEDSTNRHWWEDFIKTVELCCFKSSWLFNIHHFYPFLSISICDICGSGRAWDSPLRRKILRVSPRRRSGHGCRRSTGARGREGAAGYESWVYHEYICSTCSMYIYIYVDICRYM